MRTELILTRDDKSKVKIEVELQCNYGTCLYSIYIFTKQFRKQIWIDLYDRWDGRISSLQKINMELAVVTKEEIHQAKMKLWKSIEPKLEKKK